MKTLTKRRTSRYLAAMTFALFAWLGSHPSGELVEPALAHGLPDVTTLFENQKGRVVSIRTEVATRTRGFWGQSAQSLQQGQGSGFFFDAEGHIITNNHVIEGASSIEVHLQSGEHYSARLVGTDPKTDIAVLKVDVRDKKFPAAALGESRSLKIGEWVVAIGSPFGLELSVTAGIISAKGRQLGAGPYDDFLQTDASINPGNSGGPLFNMQGQVVGVNTAIIRDGQGIGFAVPIDLVKHVVDQLKQNGFVSRGFIGAGVEDVGPELAKLAGLQSAAGVLVRSVSRGGPAHQAGLLPGDIVTHIDGSPVQSMKSLLLKIAETKPGTSTVLLILRNRETKQVNVKVTNRPDERPLVHPASHNSRRDPGLGVEVNLPR